MSTHFDDTQYANAYPPSMQRHFWFLARCRIILRTLEKHSLKTQKILEIGCGTGGVVAKLRSEGVNVDGCDLATVPEVLLLSPHITTGVSAFDLPKESRASYSAILLLDVLEHIENRPDFLGKIYEHFPNANYLIATLPAREELRTNYDEFYGHFIRYDRSTLAREVSGTGWALVKSRYIFHLLYWPMLISAKIIGKREVKLTGPKQSSFPFHNLLATLFNIESKIVPGFIPGTSIIATLKR